MSSLPRPPRDPIDRFLDAFEVDEETGCWLWQLSCDKNGYGQFSTSRSTTARAPTWAWKTFRGSIPPGMTVEHKCHTRNLATCPGGRICLHRPCVNWVSHLELITRGENVRRGGYAQRTHCPADHEYTKENTYITKNGTRQCRKCKAVNQLRYIASLAARGLPRPR
jgi:hypothetical protein